MAIYDLAKRIKLVEQGIDPDLVPDYAPPVQQNPVKAPTAEISSDKPSFLGALGRTALRGTPAALAGAGIAAGLGTALEATGVGFIPGLALQLGGAGLASYLTRKGQDAAIANLAPKDLAASYENSTIADQTQQPVASTLGNLAAGGVFKPKLSPIMGAGRAIRDLITPDKLVHAKDLGALANVGIGATLPTALRYASDPNVSAKELALEAAGGALFNEPTRIGRKLGLHANIDREFPLANLKEAQLHGTALPENDSVVELAGQQQPASAIAASLQEQGVASAPTQEFLQKFQDLGLLRHIKVTPEGTLIGPEGNEVAGVAVLREGLNEAKALFSQKKAGLDTIPHEMFHAFYDDLGKLGSDADKGFLSKAESLFKDNKGYQDWAASRAEGQDTSVAEYITKRTGEDVIRRTLSTDKKGAVRNWLEDFQSRIKNKYGKANDDDLIRIFSSRFIDDPSFDEQFKVSRVVRPPNEEDTKPDNTAANYPQLGNKPSADGLKVRVPRSKLVGLAERLGDEANYPTIGKGKPVDVIKTSEELANYPQVGDKKLAGTRRVPKSSVTAAGEIVRQGNEANYQDLKATKPIKSSKLPGMLQEDSELREAPVIYKGKFGASGDFGGVHIYDLKETLSPTLVKGSTVTEPTLIKNGFSVPKDLPKHTPEELAKLQTMFGDRLQEESNLRFAPKTDLPANENTPSKPIEKAHFYSPEIKKIEAQGEAGQKVGKNFRNFYDKLNFNRGEFVNSFMKDIYKESPLKLSDAVKGNVKTYIEQDTPEFRKVVKYFDSVYDGKEAPTLNAAETKIKNLVQKSLLDVRTKQQAAGIGRETSGSNENYFPQTIDKEVIKELTQNPSSPASAKLKEDFLKYQTDKVGSAQAKENLKSLIEGYSKDSLNTAESFGPIDKAEGIGLPESWRDKNLLSRMTRYLDRVARRFAYAETIQNDPDFQAAFDSVKSNKSVETVFNDIAGANRMQDEAIVSAMGGLVRSGMLGTLTGAKDFVANLTLGFQHHDNPVQAVQSALHAWSNMKSNMEDSFLTGRNRIHLNTLELDQGAENITGVIRRVRDVLSDVSGRNWLEQVTRATAFGQGKFLAADFAAQARKGTLSSQGKKFFDEFGEGLDPKNLTAKDFNTLAAHYVDSVQGQYDYRGLPRIAVEGQFSPILQLARWNIEKTNNFLHHVVNPARKGDFKPFFMATIGMFLGGEAVTQLVELITGRKEKTAKANEIAASYENGNSVVLPTLYKMVGLASASGYAGLMGDFVKTILDKTYAKNKAQSYNNLLVESIQNSAQSLGDLVSGLQENGLTPDLAIEFAGRVLEDNMQAYRLILAHISEDKKEDIEKSNKLRDLRVFNTLEGNPISDLTESYPRPFGDLDLKKYKKTENLEEAMDMLPGLITKALAKANGNPDRLKQELGKLKQNSYPTMPNPDSLPVTFLRYLDHLKRTQGEEEASKRLTDYITRNAVNQAKY